MCIKLKFYLRLTGVIDAMATERVLVAQCAEQVKILSPRLLRARSEKL